MKRVRGIGLLVAAAILVGATAAEAASVAYIDRGGVWVSALNGKAKRKVAGKTKDGRKWRELAQADNGRILAVRRPPKKMSTINSFTLWGPTGKRIHQGTLGYETGWTSYAYPLSLDLTANGRNVVYGYSVMRYAYPVSQLDEGTYVNYADRVGIYTPFKISGEKWPTVAGNRIVSATSDTLISVQKTAGQPPFSDKFQPWLGFNPEGFELQRIDVAANGKLAGIQLVEWDGGQVKRSRILMVRIGSLGGSASAQCMLPAKGLAKQASLSQDGRSVAWQDRRGVVVSGAPVFGKTTCGLKRRAVVISKTGSYPSIGKAKVKVKKKKRRKRHRR